MAQTSLPFSNSTNKICSVGDCGKPEIARGWCHKHYKRWQIHGDVSVVRTTKKLIVEYCSVQGCSRTRSAKTFCQYHYQRNHLYGDPTIYFRTETLAERLWKRVDKNGPVHPDLGTRCWLWTGSRKKRNSYGNIGVGGKTQSVHRVAYELTYNVKVGNLNVLHKCDIPNCVRPEHLFLGTQEDNIRDMVQKARQRGAVGSRQFHSKLTEEQVLEIRKALAHTPIEVIARQYGVSPSAVDHIKARRTWRHI